MIIWLCVLAGVVVWAIQGIWKSGDKQEEFIASQDSQDGVVIPQDGILTKLPDEEARNAVIDSIDPVTGMPSKQLDPAQPINGEKIDQVRIVQQFENSIIDLTFDVAYRDKHPVILTNSDKPYILKSIPNSDETLIEYQENLYIINVQNKTIDKALADRVEQYEINDVLDKISQKKVENLGLTWGRNANFNADGTKMIYYSNRNTAFNDQYNGELWLKDWTTGEEMAITEWKRPIGWGEDNEIFASAGYSIVRINLTSSEVTPIIDHYSQVGFSYPYIIYQVAEGELFVLNLDTNETKQVESTSLHLIRNIFTIDNSISVLLENAPYRTTYGRTLLLLHLETHELIPLDFPSNVHFQHAQWINSEQLLVTAVKEDMTTQESYIYELNHH